MLCCIFVNMCVIVQMVPRSCTALWLWALKHCEMLRLTFWWITVSVFTIQIFIEQYNITLYQNKACFTLPCFPLQSRMPCATTSAFTSVLCEWREEKEQCGQWMKQSTSGGKDRSIIGTNNLTTQGFRELGKVRNKYIKNSIPCLVKQILIQH